MAYNDAFGKIELQTFQNLQEFVTIVFVIGFETHQKCSAIKPVDVQIEDIVLAATDNEITS